MALRNTIFLIGFLLNLAAFAQNGEDSNKTQLDSLQQSKKTDSLNFVRQADSLKAVAAAIELKAQKQDTTNKSTSGLDSLQTNLQSLKNLDQRAQDSLGLKALELHTQKYQAKLDSIKRKKNELSNTTVGVGVADSLKAIENKLKVDMPGSSIKNKLDSSQNKITKAVDPNTYINKLNGKVDGLQQKAVDTVSTRIQRKFSKVNATQDSLSTLANKPDEVLTNTQGKIEGKTNQIVSGAQNKVEGKADQLVSGTQNKVGQKVDDVAGLPGKGLNKLPDTDITNKVDMPVGTDKLPGVPDADVPATDLGNVDMPMADLPGDALKTQDIPGVEVDGLNGLTQEPDLPESELPDITKELKEAKPDLDLNKTIKEEVDFDLENPIDKPLGDVKDEINDPINDAKESDLAKKAQKETAGIQSVTSEMEGVQTDIQSAKAGDSEALENRIATELEVSDDLSKMKRQQLEMTELQVSYEDKLKIMREMQNQELFKEKLNEALKKEAPKYFAGKEEKILEGQKVLLAYKQKYSEVSSIKELKEGTATTVKNDRFLDKFMIGADMEFIRSDVNFLDVAPYLGYELTKKWHVKAGYGWRTNVVINKGVQVNTNGTHGLRTSLNYDAFKGFIGFAGYERTLVAQPEVTPGVTEKKWSDVMVVGIRKKYKIFKSLNGDGQVLYNIRFDDYSIHKKRVNLRFGFFLDFQSKRRSGNRKK
ncbi:MAG: hypothetical protein AAGF85_04355 [Bacteroidota bacterium]